jgi:hypothetical protein
MSALTTFKELVDLAKLIPALVKLNAEGRQKIRDAVGIVADELIRGLNLVQSRIEGAKVLARSTDGGAKLALQTYMAETTNKLFDAFSEFKICRGLRETRDEFVRPFALAKATVRTENVRKINDMLNQLEQDERLIIDEVGPLLSDLSQAASVSLESFLTLAEASLKQIQSRRVKLRRLARQVHDDL